MDWTRHEALSREWIEKTGAFERSANEYISRGIASGWKDPGEEPADPRTPELGAKVVDIVREANEAGMWRELRARFPPAHAPFRRFVGHGALSFHCVRFLDDHRVVAAGAREVLVVDFTGEVAQAPRGALDFGSSPDRRYFALLYEKSVAVTAGWGGEEVGRFPRPRGDEDVIAGVAPLASDAREAQVEQLAVMPDGRAVVLATDRGVFLSSASGVRRLSPDQEQLATQVADWKRDEGGAEPYPLRIDMAHVAVHPSGELIACGHQFSQHELRRPDGTRVASFGPIDSEYAHHAAFSPDGELAIFNSCHFYNGATAVGRVSDLHGLRIDEWEPDPRLAPLEGGARVYASSFHDGSFLLGEANGSVLAVRPSGAIAWHHYTGGSVFGVDVSPDGRRLAIGTDSGFLSLLELDDERDPFQRGDGPFRERIRYVRWKGEALWRW